MAQVSRRVSQVSSVSSFFPQPEEDKILFFLWKKNSKGVEKCYLSTCQRLLKEHILFNTFITTHWKEHLQISRNEKRPLQTNWNTDKHREMAPVQWNKEYTSITIYLLETSRVGWGEVGGEKRKNPCFFQGSKLCRENILQQICCFFLEHILTNDLWWFPTVPLLHFRSFKVIPHITLAEQTRPPIKDSIVGTSPRSSSSSWIGSLCSGAIASWWSKSN